MFYPFFSLIFLIIPVLINVAFITLLERKVLALMQSRKGPNQVSMIGILQPFADALKLFSKEHIQPLQSNYWLFTFAPTMSLILAIWVWSVLPMEEMPLIFNYSAILFLLIISFNIYPLLIAGWASNNKYALLGAIRGVAQTISYEISMGLLLFSMLSVISSSSLLALTTLNQSLVMIWLMAPSMILWLGTCVAETNRAPFDFAEGESELVSGFNVEYSSKYFALVFMSEYAMILFFSTLTSTLFFFSSTSSWISLFWATALVYFWVWIRASFPRYRYDKLMNLAWKIFLPSALLMIFFHLLLVAA